MNKTKLNNYSCYQCNTEFDSEQKLLDHNLSIHKIICSCSTYEHDSVNCYQKEQLKTYTATNYTFSNELRKVHFIKHISFNSKKSVFEVPNNKVKSISIKTPKSLNQLSTVMDYFNKNIDKVNIKQNVNSDYQAKYSRNYKNDKLSLLDLNINKNKDHSMNTDLSK